MCAHAHDRPCMHGCMHPWLTMLACTHPTHRRGWCVLPGGWPEHHCPVLPDHHCAGQQGRPGCTVWPGGVHDGAAVQAAAALLRFQGVVQLKPMVRFPHCVTVRCRGIRMDHTKSSITWHLRSDRWHLYLYAQLIVLTLNTVPVYWWLAGCNW